MVDGVFRSSSGCLWIGRIKESWVGFRLLIGYRTLGVGVWSVGFMEIYDR